MTPAYALDKQVFCYLSKRLLELIEFYH